MKNNTLSVKLLAKVALALGVSLAAPLSFAGPGSGATIWRKVDKPAAPVATVPVDNSMRVCTGARMVTIQEHKWIRTGGRGPHFVDAGTKLMCTSCDTPMIARKTSDRNSNGPKAFLAIKGLHDCTKDGCAPGTSVARVE